MVVPFLSVYLTQSLRFSLEQTGIILTIFGAGRHGGFAAGRLAFRPDRAVPGAVA
jgi:predicted MFS family arabinose efflux permease